MEKNIVTITGAVRGIGRATSFELARHGCVIVCADIREPDDEVVVEYLKELREISPESIYVKADISKDEDEKRFIDTAFEKFGRIDIHVNNAGIAPKVRADLLEMSRDSMDALLNVNLKGTFFLTQYVANRMITEKCGKMIINVTSMSAYTSSTNRGEYCISKAGLSMVTTLFADRLSEYGINVYEIRPGIIATDMTSKVRDKYDALIAGGLLPISRIGQPQDIANAVSALAQGALAYSTGEVLNIDGGFHIRKL